MDFEIGGRNQNTQLFRRLCKEEDVDIEAFESDNDALDAFVPSSFCFSTVGVFADVPTTLKSSAPPVAFGVFAEPKDANAPDPKPKALDAPAVGEAIELVGVDANGFLPPCEELSCLRLRLKERAEWSTEPFVLEVPVDSESLVLLNISSLVMRQPHTV